MSWQDAYGHRLDCLCPLRLILVCNLTCISLCLYNIVIVRGKACFASTAIKISTSIKCLTNEWLHIEIADLLLLLFCRNLIP